MVWLITVIQGSAGETIHSRCDAGQLGMATQSGQETRELPGYRAEITLPLTRHYQFAILILPSAGSEQVFLSRTGVGSIPVLATIAASKPAFQSKGIVEKL
jgi:hypothetical protein